MDTTIGIIIPTLTDCLFTTPVLTAVKEKKITINNKSNNVNNLQPEWNLRYNADFNPRKNLS